MSPNTAPSSTGPGRVVAWRVAAGAAALTGYALLSHWLMVNAAGRPWAVAVLFGPLVVALAAAGWQRGQRWLLASCAAAVAVLAAVVWLGGVDDVNRMYVLQHAGIHLALAYGFGSTLRAGSVPLISGLAEALHLSLHHRFTPAMRDYTRRLTALWTGYFVAMVVLSMVIYWMAPWSWWSLFCNLLTPLSAALLFIGEHLLRYRRHPEFERVTLSSALAAYRQSGGLVDGLLDVHDAKATHVGSR